VTAWRNRKLEQKFRKQIGCGKLTDKIKDQISGQGKGRIGNAHQLKKSLNTTIHS